MSRRGLTLVEMAVAIAVALTLYLALAGQMDALHRMQRMAATKLAAREAAALAARRWLADPSPETRRTLEMYGIGKPHTDDYGRRLLLARRLVEKGVRFICPVSGGGPGNMQWDAHDDIEENHVRMASQTDQPIAALLKDLKQRGLLDSTLVVWGGEFGRSPESQGSKGRDHHNLGYTMWMAGGGIKGGKVIGSTDEIGFKAVEDPVHINDIHATILGLLGLDHKKLTYLFQGRNFRLSDVGGENNLAPRLVGA